MLPYRDSLTTRAALGLFFVIVVFYAYYEARGALYGPSITVPQGPTIVHDSFIKISGKAERIATLHMNGKAIPVTEEGVFEEPYVLAEGYNRISLQAEYKYGRSREQFIEIVYDPVTVENASGTVPAAF